MGIRGINKYLLANCSRESIQRISLHDLRGRTVVVDAFQFLYKFLGENRLAEHMDRMVTILFDNEITPVFVFDGKPPAEKKTVLEERRTKKQDAKLKYDALLQKIASESNSPGGGIEALTRVDLASELASLKKRFLRIDYEHIQCVKRILTQHKVAYVDAPGEADAVCVEMVQKQQAWACMSDDMDMFAYGCDRVLREWSMHTHKVTLYRMSSILLDLRMSMQEFREILVVSGTDYDGVDETGQQSNLAAKGDLWKGSSSHRAFGGACDAAAQRNLYETLKWFEAYRRDTHRNHRQPSRHHYRNHGRRHPTRCYELPRSYGSMQDWWHDCSQRLPRGINTQWGWGDDDTNKNPIGFYPWLVKHTKYVRDYDRLMQIYRMFDV